MVCLSPPMLKCCAHLCVYSIMKYLNAHPYISLIPHSQGLQEVIQLHAVHHSLGNHAHISLGRGTECMVGVVKACAQLLIPPSLVFVVNINSSELAKQYVHKSKVGVFSLDGGYIRLHA